MVHSLARHTHAIPRMQQVAAGSAQRVALLFGIVVFLAVLIALRDYIGIDTTFAAKIGGPIELVGGKPLHFSIAFLLSLALHGVADALLRVVMGPRSKGARWFALHSASNWITAALALHSIFYWLSDIPFAMDYFRSPPPPLFAGVHNASTSTWRFDRTAWRAFFVALTAPNSDWVSINVICVHVYHCLPGLFVLTSADIFHHITFVFPLLLSSMFVRCGPLRNCVSFFISGLPGAMDYALLACYKHSGQRLLGGALPTPLITKLTEKRVNRVINAWLRAPGLLCVVFSNYLGTFTGRAPSQPPLINLMMGAFVIWNAIHFMDQAIANHATHAALAAYAATAEMQRGTSEKKEKKG